MNYIILCTIPHTGTNFFANIFERAGYQKIGVNANRGTLDTAPPSKVGWLTRCHVSKDNIRFCRNYARQGATVCTTVRTYEDIEASWKARHKAEDLQYYKKLHDELIGTVEPLYMLSIDPKMDNTERWLEFYLTTDLPMIPKIIDFDEVVNRGPHR